MARDKICVWCRYFSVDMGEPGYSEVTPGVDASVMCLRNHWSMEWYDGNGKYRKHILKAETCPDWEEIP
jgi:hypothetical protein